jgi:cleavage and polyadenylation specificity factor subunit 1
MITEVELPGCKGIWTVYHKSSRGHNADSSKMAADEDEYHAYLIISLEARTMVYFASVCWLFFIRSFYYP